MPERFGRQADPVLDGAAEALCHSSAGGRIVLEEYVAALNRALEVAAGRIEQFVGSLPDRSPAARIAGLSGLEKRLIFGRFDNQDAATLLRKVVRDPCETEARFRQAVELVAGPSLDDD